MPILLRLYAIRHIPTGRFMPERMGYTYWDPFDQTPGGYGGLPSSPPRFFLDRHAAAMALGYWAKVPWKRHLVMAGSWDAPSEYQAGTVPTNPKTPRNRTDLEIVTFDAKELP